MDTRAFIIISASVLLYFFSKRRPVFLFTTGVGVGLLIGAIWSCVIVARAIDGMLP